MEDPGKVRFISSDSAEEKCARLLKKYEDARTLLDNRNTSDEYKYLLTQYPKIIDTFVDGKNCVDRLSNAIYFDDFQCCVHDIPYEKVNDLLVFDTKKSIVIKHDEEKRVNFSLMINSCDKQLIRGIIEVGEYSLLDRDPIIMTNMSRTIFVWSRRKFHRNSNDHMLTVFTKRLLEKHDLVATLHKVERVGDCTIYPILSNVLDPNTLNIGVTSSIWKSILKCVGWEPRFNVDDEGRVYDMTNPNDTANQYISQNYPNYIDCKEYYEDYVELYKDCGHAILGRNLFNKIVRSAGYDARRGFGQNRKWIPLETTTSIGEKN
jgi:hypothetical protein